MLRSSSVRRSPEANEANYGPRNPSEHSTIRDVWAWNLEEELDAIMCVVQKYNYVAVDTKFAGVLVRPDELEPSIHQSSLVRDTINLMEFIHISFTFLDPNGLPSPNSRDEEVYAEDSIVVLIGSGTQSDGYEREGIDADELAHRPGHDIRHRPIGRREVSRPLRSVRFRLPAQGVGGEEFAAGRV